ncbi:MAG: helix-turn-helix transcriptional regulator [Anaerolineales bacterium]|nr:helix-turn-helix transcriptional regulator [Anaerolineales bacterium]
MDLERIFDLVADKQSAPNKFTIEMGKKVRAARAEAGMTQGSLAEMVGRRQATISDIEHGKKEMGLSTLVLIAAALNKPISYFLPGEIANYDESS